MPKIDKDKLQVWECKVVIPAPQLPRTFDPPMRNALRNLLESKGIDVLGISSGWGGDLTYGELCALEESIGDVYFAGLLDEQEGGKH